MIQVLCNWTLCGLLLHVLYMYPMAVAHTHIHRFNVRVNLPAHALCDCNKASVSRWSSYVLTPSPYMYSTVVSTSTQVLYCTIPHSIHVLPKCSPTVSSGLTPITTNRSEVATILSKHAPHTSNPGKENSFRRHSPKREG